MKFSSSAGRSTSPFSRGAPQRNARLLIGRVIGSARQQYPGKFNMGFARRFVLLGSGKASRTRLGNVVTVATIWSRICDRLHPV